MYSDYQVKKALKDINQNLLMNTLQTDIKHAWNMTIYNYNSRTPHFNVKRDGRSCSDLISKYTPEIKVENLFDPVILYKDVGHFITRLKHAIVDSKTTVHKKATKQQKETDLKIQEKY